MVILNGILISGFGEGKFYMQKYSDNFRDKLGYIPWLGTLNIKINSKINISKDCVVIDGFNEAEKTFGSIKCYPCIINNKNIKVNLVVPEINKHKENIIELISPLNLRKTLNIKDGDEINIKLI